MLRYFIRLFLLLYSLVFISCGNKGNGSDPDFKFVKGYVIEREICDVDEISDYWVIDFSYGNNPPPIGDTITIQGLLYLNALKVKGLDARLKYKGMGVGIDYRTISPSKIIQQDCNNPIANIYPLKELVILYQSELR